MMVVVTYDINTETVQGRGRLRKVAKICLNHGQRVQNSVFECIVDEGQFRKFCSLLQEEIDVNTDSLRFYRLGNAYKSKISHVGAKKVQNIEDPLIF